MRASFIGLTITAMVLAASPVQADGFFVGAKINRATVDISRSTEPSIIDSSRTRPALFLGYQWDDGLEVQVEHWSGSTGLAECSSDPCPLIAVSTKARLTNATVGYEWFPAAGPFSLVGRVGVQHGRASFGTDSRTKTAALVGAGARYRVTQNVAVGLEATASSFKTRTAGIELRIGF